VRDHTEVTASCRASEEKRREEREEKRREEKRREEKRRENSLFRKSVIY
jgi:hypothetical protein